MYCIYSNLYGNLYIDELELITVQRTKQRKYKVMEGKIIRHIKRPTLSLSPGSVCIKVSQHQFNKH